VQGSGCVDCRGQGGYAVTPKVGESRSMDSRGCEGFTLYAPCRGSPFCAKSMVYKGLRGCIECRGCRVEGLDCHFGSE